MTAFKDLSEAERRAAWDAYHGLTDRRWQLYRCSDCDPGLLDADDDADHPARQYTEPYRIICQIGAARPDSCPRCSSYLSLCEATEVYVTSGKPEAVR